MRRSREVALLTRLALAAAVVQRQGFSTSSAELAAWCRSHLSSYKVPYSFAFVGELPTTGSGKVLKRQLRELYAAGALQSDETKCEHSSFYTTAWPESESCAAVSPQTTRHWLLFGETVESADPLRAELQSRDSGAQITALSRAAVLEPSFAQTFSGHLERGPTLGVVILWPLECALGYMHGCAAAVEEVVSSCMHCSLAIIQMILASCDAAKCVSVSFVTCGAVVVQEAEAEEPAAAHQLALSLAPLVGLLRSIRAEYPVIPLRCFDLPPPTSSLQNSALADFACTLSSQLTRGQGQGGNELPVAFRREQVLVPRLRRVSAPGSTMQLPKSSRGLAIFGGFGSTGLLHAAFLLQKRMNVQTIALFGRAVSVSAETQMRTLGTTYGCAVLAVQVDIADEAEVMLAFRLLAEAAPQQAWGVLHFAGVFHEASAMDTTAELCRTTLEPKLTGAIYVADCVCSILPRTEFLIIGSSALAILAAPRVAAVASADCIADLLAWQLRALDVCALAVHWGSWNAAGSLPSTLPSQVGLKPQAGLDALNRVLCSALQGQLQLPLAYLHGVSQQSARNDHVLEAKSSAAVVHACVRSVLGARDVLDCNVPLAALGMTSLKAVEAQAALQHALDLSLPTTILFDCPTMQDVVAFVDRLRETTVTVADARARVRAAVVAALSKVLASSVLSALDHSEPLTSAGLSSVNAVAVREELETVLEQRLPATLLFDHPSVDALVQQLTQDVATAGTAIKDALPAAQLPTGFVVVVCGQASRTPCDAPGEQGCLPDQSVSDGIKLIPFMRWDIDAVLLWAQDANAARFGGTVLDADLFDADLFGISPTEASGMDPQQRLVLGVSHLCLSGTDANLKERAVLVGISQVEYPLLLHTAGSPLAAYSATGSHLSVAAGRVSFTYGFKAAALSVDTACSSSLVTAHLSHRMLIAGDVKRAISGGVNLTLAASWTVSCGRAGMLAGDGRCKTLDAAADGYVRSEACAVVDCAAIDTRDAEATPGLILSVLAGTALNQDGRSSSLTAPHGPSQQAVLRDALSNSRGSLRLRARVLQMHGTGTPLGDPIEVGAALTCFSDDEAELLTLTSFKATAGHAEPAAGIVGLIRAASNLVQTGLSPLLHLRSLNLHLTPLVAFWATPATRRLKIPRQHVGAIGDCTAHVSSFAFQGTNAHAVLQRGNEWPVFMHHFMLGAQQRFWTTPTPHVLLLAVTATAQVACTVALFDRPDCAFIRDHRVLDRILFPGSGFLELAFLSASTACVEPANNQIIASMTLSAPLIFSQSAPVRRATVTLEVASGGLTVQTATINERLVVHACAWTRSVHPRSASAGHLQQHSFGCAKSAAGAFRALLKHCFEQHADGWLSHPALLDNAIHLGEGALGQPAEFFTRIPVTIETYESIHPVTYCRNVAAVARVRDFCGAVSFNDHALAGPAQYASSVRRLEVRAVSQVNRHAAAPMTVDATGRVLYELVWQASTLASDGRALSLRRSLLTPAFHQRACNWAVIGQRRFTSCLALLHVSLVLAGNSREQNLPRSSHAVCTRGKQPCSVSPALRSASGDAALWGLSRTVVQEFPEVGWQIQDHDAVATSSQTQLRRSVRQPSQIKTDDPLYGIVFSSGAIMSAMLQSSSIRHAPATMQLLPEPRGSLGGLRAVAMQTGAAPAGCLVVAVQAVGLNFRDVLNVLGMYPGDPGPPGGDCAGLVVSGGQGARFFPGEACFGLAPGSLGTHVVVAAQMMASKPCRLGFEEAAAPSTVYVTVDLALWRAGGHSAAGVLLVHGAAGGVGLAAVDVSRGAGVRTVGSAGNAQKRALLRRLGLAWTASSRGTGFAAAAAQATCGAGCGLVLNSLTSAGMVAASLASLGVGGRVVEISKRDVWSVRRADMERSDAGLRLVALDFLPPAAAGAALQRLAASLARGLVGAAGGVAQSLARTRAAMRQMSKAQHCGKLVLLASCVAGILPSSLTLVTGGLGALGLLLSLWLAQMGAPALLTSRQGRADRPCWFSKLPTGGAVHISRCSSSCVSESIELLSMLCVSSVLHVGGSLSDAVLGNQSMCGVRQVFSPKCTGSHVLQRSTRLQPLTHLSVFSSISALLGNAGQANCTHPTLHHLAQSVLNCFLSPRRCCCKCMFRCVGTGRLKRRRRDTVGAVGCVVWVRHGTTK